jgi:hypothetical protein
MVFGAATWQKVRFFFLILCLRIHDCISRCGSLFVCWWHHFYATLSFKVLCLYRSPISVPVSLCHATFVGSFVIYDPLSLKRDIFLSSSSHILLLSLFLSTMFLSCYLYSVYQIFPNLFSPSKRTLLLSSVKFCSFMLRFPSVRTCTWCWRVYDTQSTFLHENETS